MVEEKKQTKEVLSKSEGGVPPKDGTGGKKKEEQAQPEKEVQPAQDAEKKEESKKSNIQVSKKMQDIISSIEGMTVLELADLIKILEEKFGVTAAQPMIAAAGVAGAGAPGAAVAEEKTSFTVVLANVGSNKIQVIKEVRAITTLGLREAKDLVESAPKPVKEGIAKEEAEEVKKKLEAVGAKVELK